MVFLVNSIIIVICLLLFFTINLHNILRYHRRQEAMEVRPEVPRPRRFALGLAALGTFVFFLESIIYLILDIFQLRLPPVSFFNLALTQTAVAMIAELLGAFIMVLGYVLFIWSVLARGRFAVSWAMPPQHRLVDWGPYRYVRHPSYLGYFLMFIGFLIMWHNLLAVIPLLAIPGYVSVTISEEEMLTRTFGKKYEEYKRRVRRYLPRVRKSEMNSAGD